MGSVGNPTLASKHMALILQFLCSYSNMFTCNYVSVEFKDQYYGSAYTVFTLSRNAAARILCQQQWQQLMKYAHTKVHRLNISI
jgi:hypothetical protein